MPSQPLEQRSTLKQWRGCLGHLGLPLLLVVGLSLTPGCLKSPKPEATRAPLPPDLERQCTPAARHPIFVDVEVEKGRVSGNELVSVPPHHEEPSLPLPVPLTPHAQRLAEVLGIHPFLSRVVRLQEESRQQVEGADLRLLDAGQDLSDRFLQLMVEVSEIVAELDCERARSEELAVRLEEIENDIRNKRTVTAIMAEPIFHILAATSLVFGMPVVAGGLEIVGNGIRLSFGLAADRVSQDETMSHTHNFLQEVWEGPEHPRLFPPSVWRFLNQPAKNGSGATRREVILEVWRGHLGASGSSTEKRRVELFFGSGGVYGVRDLRHRADMLRVLSAFVTLMIHDIGGLFNETLIRPA
jgi:hypothetical protein